MNKTLSEASFQKKSLRKKILDLLKQKHMLTAPDIIGRLKVKGDVYNKTSVYRALEKLLDEGKICRQLFRKNDVYYELRADHHDHFVCENCDKIEKIPCQQMVIPTTIGTISHHHATWYGTCRECG